MKTAATTVLLLACLLLPASASAKKPHRMTFQFATVVAVDYWAKRGITVPCHPRERLFTKQETKTIDSQYLAAGITNGFSQVDMLAYPEICTVGVTPLADWYRTQQDYAWMYCSEIIHELGHLAGLAHDDNGGIMDPWGDGMPWGCTHPIKFRASLGRRDTAGSRTTGR